MNSSLVSALARRIDFSIPANRALEGLYYGLAATAVLVNPSSSRQLLDRALGVGTDELPLAAPDLNEIVGSRQLTVRQRRHVRQFPGALNWTIFVTCQRMPLHETDEIIDQVGVGGLNTRVLFEQAPTIGLTRSRYYGDVVNDQGLDQRLNALVHSKPGEFRSYAESWLREGVNEQREAIIALIVDRRPDLLTSLSDTKLLTAQRIAYASRHLADPALRDRVVDWDAIAFALDERLGWGWLLTLRTLVSNPMVPREHVERLARLMGEDPDAMRDRARERVWKAADLENPNAPMLYSHVRARLSRDSGEHLTVPYERLEGHDLARAVIYMRWYAESSHGAVYALRALRTNPRLSAAQRIELSNAHRRARRRRLGLYLRDLPRYQERATRPRVTPPPSFPEDLREVMDDPRTATLWRVPVNRQPWLDHRDIVPALVHSLGPDPMNHWLLLANCAQDPNRALAEHLATVRAQREALGTDPQVLSVFVTLSGPDAVLSVDERIATAHALA